MSNNKEKKVKNFPSSFIGVQIVVLYLTLMIGDIIVEASDISTSIIRYLSIAVVGFVSVYLLIKNTLKECTSEVYESVHKFSKLLPIAVAVILLFYGLFSVESNVSELENDYSYKWIMSLSETFGEESYLEKIIEEAKAEARTMWIISSIIYLVAAEAAVYLALNNSTVNIVEENNKVNTMNEGFERVGGFEQNEIEEETEEEIVNNEEEGNPIKFDL
ncbi:MAG: hypothetical protein E7311_02745 [Clostridiales bacterium]|nr:hypothetical protein [Clostridiales bacterium]